MKKILCIAAAAALLLTFAACKTAPADTSHATPEELLAQIREASHADLAASIGNEITAGNAPRALGLSEEQFEKFVLSAFVETPVLARAPQSNAVIMCKSGADAAQVKKLIADGFSSDQWASVPEQSIVVESGSYVLLAVGSAEATDAFVQAFSLVCNGGIGSPSAP